jgi:hypothetical protein
MLRKTFYLTEEQNKYFLEHTLITASEHIRRAIDDYIKKQKSFLVSSSLSEEKGGKNGRY